MSTQQKPALPFDELMRRVLKVKPETLKARIKAEKEGKQKRR